MSEVKLSERVRPAVEAAPWVYTAIQKLERDYGALRAENERLVNEQLAFADAVAQKIVAKDAQIVALRNERDSHAMDLDAMRQPVAGDQQAEREAFEAELLRLGYPFHVSARNETGYNCGFGAEYWRIWQARAALSAPATGPDVGALVEAETEIRTFEDSNWHGSKGYHAGLLKAAGIVAALAAHKAGGGDHE